MQFDAGVGFGRSEKSYGAAFNVGVDRGPYAGVSIAHVSEETNGASSGPAGTMLGGTIGYQANLKTKTVMQVCPVASFERRSMDYNVSDPATMNRTQGAVGATMGFVVPTHSEIHFVPFAGLSYAHRSDLLRVGSSRYTTHENYTPGVFGMGAHFGSKWMLTGQVTVPFGLDGADPVYGLSAVLPFGRSR